MSAALYCKLLFRAICIVHDSYARIGKHENKRIKHSRLDVRARLSFLNRVLYVFLSPIFDNRGIDGY